MEGVNGKPFTTNQYAIVAMGKTQKEWPFLACSNSKFTEVCYSHPFHEFFLTLLVGIYRLEEDHD